MKSLLAPEIDENVELSTDTEVRYSTPLSLENSAEYSERFQQLSVIWLLVSQSKLVVSNVNSDEVAYKICFQTLWNIIDNMFCYRAKKRM